MAFWPWLGVSVLATWLLAFAMWRVSSLSALIAAAFAPLYAAAFFGFGLRTLTVLLLSAMLVWRHRSNIRKLLELLQHSVEVMRAEADVIAADAHCTDPR